MEKCSIAIEKLAYQSHDELNLLKKNPEPYEAI